LAVTERMRPETSDAPWKEPYGLVVGATLLPVVPMVEPAVTDAFGLEKFGWFKVLKACAPNSRAYFSLKKDFR
jgi:hypothetical protein